MKLEFTKNEDGEIFVKIGLKEFSNEDYIRMIKEIKSAKKIEANFGDNISKDEQDSVLLMLKSINNIKTTGDNAKEKVEKKQF